MVDHPDFTTLCDAQGRDLVPTADNNLPDDPAHTTALINATEDGRTMPVQSNIVSADYAGRGKRPGSFSGLPNWDGKERPRDPATGQFVSKESDAAIIQAAGFVPEVATALAAEP